MSDRYQLKIRDEVIKTYKKMSGAKAAVTYQATRYRIFSYRAVDTKTGQTWKWDHQQWKLVQVPGETPVEMA